MKRAQNSVCPRLPFFAFILLSIALVVTPLAFAASPTITQLTVAPSPSVPAGTVLTFTASVTASGTPLTSGLVTFCDMEIATYCEDSAVLGKVWLTRSGIATLRTTLSYGGHNIQAVFQANNAFSGSASDIQTVSVLSGPLPTITTVSSVQYYGYGGLNQAQLTVRGAPIPILSGTVLFLDATNANYPLTSLSVTAPTVSYTPLTSVGGVPVQKPEFTAVGDFNGDGYLDFVVASNYANTVQVYLGAGNGTFTLMSSYTSTYPAGLVTADFNGDGSLDFAVLNSNSISVFLGNGDGTFTSPSPTTTSNYPYSFTVADVNGDGIPDLAYTNNYTNKVYLLLGVGDGTFVAGNFYATGKYPEGIVAADFNRDGFIDLAVVNEMENTVTILMGDGTGAYTAAPLLTVPATPYTLVAADFNGDGITDLAVSAITQGAEIYLGNGDGSFGLKSTLTNGSSGNGYGMAITDFNADGKTDLIVGKALFIGDGFGNFTVMGYAGGSGAAISVADFNGDGSPDLLAPVYATASPYNGTPYIALEQATFTKLVSSIKVLGPGSHNVYASYGGDSGHAASQSSLVSMTGAQISTTTALSVSPSMSVAYGTNVQFTATMSPGAIGNYVPSGTVTFKEGTNVLGTGTINSGMAAITINTLSVGSHTITAVYGGDVNFLTSSRSVIVTVTGGQMTPTITWPTPAPITYGTPLSTTQLNADAGSVAGTFVYTPAAGTVLNAGTQTLSTTFTPTDTVTYTTATATVQLTVQKAMPAISTWPVASAITYGQNLTFASLGGGVASVPGTFAFTNPSTVPPAGTSAQSVTFTPTDTTNYNTVVGNSNVTVNPATQTITVTTPAPANAAYQTQFTVAATASSGLAVAYSSAGGCTNVGPTFTMTSGTTACTVKFDQPGDTNYQPAAEIIETVTANKATPTVTTWPTASPITDGQDLNLSMLSGGVASVPGAFAFTNPGTVPAVGTSIQSVTFTPSDISDYNNVVGSVNVTVNPAGQTITVTTPAPANAAYNTQFTVAATASSGLAVTYSSAGGCTNTGAKFTMTSSTIACTVMFDQTGNANYTAAPQVTQTVTTGRATPTITAWPTASPITYGQALTTSNLTNGTASVPGTFAFTNLTFVPPAGTAVQSVTFTPTDTMNYAPVIGSATVTVNQATLTVIANNASRTYGAANPMFTATYTGFVNGDTSAALSGAPGLTTIATNTSPVGSYTITAAAGTLSSGNYAFAFVNGSMTVTQASLTITASNQSKVYGQTLNLGTTAFTATGLQNGETVGSVTLSSAGAGPTAGVALSPYPIGASSATGGTFAPGNYNINYINGLLTVAKAGTNVTVTAPNGPQKAGSLFTVTFSVASQTTQIPTGTVSITALNGFGTTVATCQPSPAPLVNGAGSCQMRINAKGTYTVMGAYSGDPNFTSNSASDTVKITP